MATVPSELLIPFSCPQFHLRIAETIAWLMDGSNGCQWTRAALKLKALASGIDDAEAKLEVLRQSLVSFARDE